MILVDSSAWIDRIRGRNTRAAARLDELLDGNDLVTTDAVALELLAGARDEAARARIDRILVSHPRIAAEAHDFDDAAAIYRACRRRGAAPRGLLDCLVAAVAIRIDAAVLHNDRAFDVIAEHVELRIDS